MGRKSKYTKEIKLQAISDYKNGNKSMGQLCKELNCSDVSILFTHYKHHIYVYNYHYFLLKLQ